MGGCAYRDVGADSIAAHARRHRDRAWLGSAVAGRMGERLVHRCSIRDSHMARRRRDAISAFSVAFDFVLCPLTVLALALHEARAGGALRALAFLGDISYSTYLIHFPMQLALALLALRFGA